MIRMPEVSDALIVSGILSAGVGLYLLCGLPWLLLVAGIVAVLLGIAVELRGSAWR